MRTFVETVLVPVVAATSVVGLLLYSLIGTIPSNFIQQGQSRVQVVAR